MKGDKGDMQLGGAAFKPSKENLGMTYASRPSKYQA